MPNIMRGLILLSAIAATFILAGCSDQRSPGGGEGTGVDPANLTTNIIALHDSKSPQYRNDCLSCHSSILTEESLDPSVPTAHNAMLAQLPDETTQEKCVHCHVTTDILQHSAGDIRRNVAVQICVTCHGPGGPSTKQYYQK